MRHLNLMILAAVLGACGESDPQPFQNLRTFPTVRADTLAGGGQSGLLAYVLSEYERSKIVVAIHDVSRPEELLTLSEAELSGWAEGPLGVAEGIVAWSDGERARVVDATVSPVEIHEIALEAGEVPSAVLARADRLVVARAARLEVYPVGSPGVPEVYDAGVAITGLHRVEDVFFAFTDTGWVRITPGTPSSFESGASETVRGFRQVFQHGTLAVAAGPAASMGRSRVCWLDLSTPTVLHEWIVPAAYGGFGWDGRDTALLADLENPSAGIYQGYLLRWSGDSFEQKGVPLQLSSRVGAQHLALHEGHVLRQTDAGLVIDVIRR